MSATPDELAFDLQHAIDAAERWEQRADERKQNEKYADEGKWTRVEDKGRLAKVINRRIGQLRQVSAAGAELPEQMKELIQLPEVNADQVDDRFAERVIGETRDFLAISFFASGMKASRAVCRIVTTLQRGRRGFGTGFMVTPRLLITNHHVLPDAATASASVAEFNFQLNPRQENEQVHGFALRPDLFFLNDKPNDFALVAVDERNNGGRDVSSFGYCPLIGVEGKIANTEWVNIIQHPKGDLKQVVIRDNWLMDLPDKQAGGAFDRYAYYKADTEPGSSGSPVFNDLWEVIALHHSSVPQRNAKGQILAVDGKVWQDGDPTRIKWVGNEGIRTSRIVNRLTEMQPAVRPEQTALYDEFMQIARSNGAPLEQQQFNNPGHRERIMPPFQPNAATHVPISINVPISIDLTIGADGVRHVAAGAGNSLAQAPVSRGLLSPPTPADSAGQGKQAVAALLDAPEVAKSKKKADPEAMKIEKPYTNRKGYDPSFLGFSAPLPKLTNKTKSLAVKVGNGHELKYHHYSVILNGKRKTAFVSAVNIDLQAEFKVTGERKDKWFFDERIDEKLQAGNDAYAHEVTDRGHLTRRADSAWGKTQHEANKANADTFHWTNCSIQHEMFNRSTLSEAQDQFLWGSIEDHIAAEAKAMNRRLSVFNGPIMKTTDKLHRGILVPQEFFKVVVCKGDDRKPQVFGFKLSQKDLVKNLPKEIFEERDFQVDEVFEAFQVRLSELEDATGLDFGGLKKFDVFAQKAEEMFAESDEAILPLRSVGDIIVRKD